MNDLTAMLGWKVQSLPFYIIYGDRRIIIKFERHILLYTFYYDDWFEAKYYQASVFVIVKFYNSIEIPQKLWNKVYHIQIYKSKIWGWRFQKVLNKYLETDLTTQSHKSFDKSLPNSKFCFQSYLNLIIWSNSRLLIMCIFWWTIISDTTNYIQISYFQDRKLVLSLIRI